MKLVVDTGACMGYANCVEHAPQVFQLGKGGLVVLLDESPAAPLHAAVLRAIDDCPTDAIAAED